MIPQNGNAYYTLDAATFREFREVAKLLQHFRRSAQKRRLPVLRMRLIRYIPKTYYRRLRAVFSFCLGRCFAKDRELAIPKQFLRADYTWYTHNALKTGDWSYLRKLHRSVTNRQRKDRLTVAWMGFAMGFLGLGVQETSCFIDALTKSILETALSYRLPCDRFAMSCLLYHTIVTGLVPVTNFPTWMTGQTG